MRNCVREYVFYVFFHIKTNMTFYVFDTTYQKVVKSQQKFSRQCVKMIEFIYFAQR